MVVRFTGGTYTDLLNQHDRFILLVYFDGQEIERESPYTLGLLPTFHNKFERSTHKAIMDEFPEITYVETFHSEAYDLVINFGEDYDELWDENNRIFRPLIISVKDGWVVKSSFGECYCTETYMDIVHSIYPELFKPTSVS